MIYYNANTNEVDKTKVIQSIVFKVSNALAISKIQGYDLTCTNFDVPNMKISFEITHIGYPVEILFYNGTVFKRSKDFAVDYKSVLDIIKNQALTPQQKEDAVDRQIETINESIAGMLYDQIKTHQVLKSFEKIVYDKYVVKKNFPSPEQMWEEFKTYYDTVKSVPSPIPFPCTIADWWLKLEETIKRNTAFWHARDDIALRRQYGIEKFVNAQFFTVYHDLEDYYCSDYFDKLKTMVNNTIFAGGMSESEQAELIENCDKYKVDFINELNGIPANVQTSIPTAV